MAFKFSVGFETLDPGRRGADKATIKLQREAVTGPGGKRRIIDEHVIEPGQPMPDLAHFGVPELTPMERIEGFTRTTAGR